MVISLEKLIDAALTLLEEIDSKLLPLAIYIHQHGYCGTDNVLNFIQLLGCYNYE